MQPSVVTKTAWLPVLAATLVLTACDEAGPGGPGNVAPQGNSVAYDRWTPGPNDTCTPEIHNSYSTVGPDGKLYPTWHPPVDPGTGCTFGHEHGRDPRGSAIYEEVGDIPFGVANEALDIFDPTLQRHEDHVGHKIEWENDVEFGFNGDAANSLLSVRCDVLVKLHQGSHSKDAFTNNMHELVMHLRCSDGAALSVTLLTPIGGAGEFVASCDRDRHILAGTPTPPNSPDGGGKRIIPDRQCVEEFLLVPEGERSNFGSGLRESWEISDRIAAEGGRTLASFNPYFQVLFPSRFFDPAVPDGVARPIDLCFPDPVTGERARGGPCEALIEAGIVDSLAFDDPRSTFTGARRFVDVNSIRINNADGPATWYTDPFGNNGRRRPFPGSVRQFIASIDNERATIPSGPQIGRDRDYGEGQSVHAPN